MALGDPLETPARTGTADGNRTFSDQWDAGDLGCGELVVGLKRRMAAVPAGSLFRLVATDAGVPLDLPSWCRLTGHDLVRAEGPVFLIRKRLEE